MPDLDRPDPISSPAPERPGRGVLALALGWFLVQMAVPASYYLGDDPHDERFAWRMFSTERQTRCRVRFFAQGEEVVLARHFHMAWITLARRGHSSVIEAMGASLCEEAGEVYLHQACRLIDGTIEPIHAGEQNLCRSGR